jgi:hypothetical protein
VLTQLSVLTIGLYLALLAMSLHLLLSAIDGETAIVRIAFIALGLWNVATGILIAIIGASAASDTSARMLSIYLGAGFATLVPALVNRRMLNSFPRCLALASMGGLLGAAVPYTLA